MPQFTVSVIVSVDVFYFVVVILVIFVFVIILFLVPFLAESSKNPPYIIYEALIQKHHFFAFFFSNVKFCTNLMCVWGFTEIWSVSSKRVIPG